MIRTCTRITSISFRFNSISTRLNDLMWLKTLGRDIQNKHTMMSPLINEILDPFYEYHTSYLPFNLINMICT